MGQKYTTETKILKTDGGHYFGIENFGNTCYINSVFQSLYFSILFREKLINYIKNIPIHIPNNKKNDKEKKKKNNLLLYELGNYFESICSRKKTFGTISPKSFIDCLRKSNVLFDNYDQHDAQEFLLFLLDNINATVMKNNKKIEEEKEKEKEEEKSEGEVKEKVDEEKGKREGKEEKNENEECEKKEEENESFVKEVFEGKLKTDTKCITCEEVSSRKEPFLVLSVGVEENISLNQSLKDLSSVEIMKGRNKFFCEHCHSYQEAQKSTRIDIHPNILIIHLKRFKYFENIQRYKKLDYRLSFSEKLKLGNEGFTYKLFAIVSHFGRTPNMGHYYAIINSHGNWILFDDDRVHVISKNKVREVYGNKGSYDTAYMLFYQKVNEDEEIEIENEIFINKETENDKGEEKEKKKEKKEKEKEKVGEKEEKEKKEKEKKEKEKKEKEKKEKEKKEKEKKHKEKKGKKKEKKKEKESKKEKGKKGKVTKKDKKTETVEIKSI